jgi:membrane protease YdiL (CAAX protease family)
MKKIRKHIYLLLAVVFISQVIWGIRLLPLQPVLNFFGIKNNVFDLAMGLVYLTAVLVVVVIVSYILNRYKIIKGETRNKVILNLIMKCFMLFIVLLPTSFTVGLFSKEAAKILNNGGTVSDVDQIIVLGVYLFWFFLINAFFVPQVDAKWGLRREEEEGVI